MHFGPGMESHTVKILKDDLFGELSQCNVGVEFQTVAFQAVMADLLCGDTIHHAFKNCIFVKTTQGREGSSDKKAQDVMTSLLQLRWLMIGEISMVSAQLLAEIDQKFRSYHTSVDLFCV